MQNPTPSPLSVLVLDDDENILRLLKIFLTQKGYRVYTATDGQAGLRRLMTRSFDLLIVDIQMPKLDGLAFAQEAKSMWPWLRMICCTGYHTAQVARTADVLGIFEILQKPLSFNNLEEAIQRCFPEPVLPTPRVMHTADEVSCAQLHTLRSFVGKQMQKPQMLNILRAFCKLMMDLIPCETASAYVREDEATYFVIRSKKACSPEHQQHLLMEIHQKFEIMGEEQAFQHPPIEAHEERPDLPATPDKHLVGMSMPVLHPKHLAGFLHLEMPANAERPSPYHQTLMCVSHHLSLILDELNRMRSIPSQDVLTGFMNRKLMENRINEIWEQRHRRSNTPALLLVDIDDLKSLNDEAGMEAGDQILMLLAKILKSKLHPSMEVARLGGDTFGILFIDSTEKEVSRIDGEIKQAWQEALEQSSEAAFQNRTISIGHVLMTSSNIHSGLEMVECAEQALQTAKRGGGGSSLSWSDLCNSEELNYDRHSVLVVDDEPQVFHLIQRMLNPNIYQVTGAGSVAEAVNLMEKGNKYHLLMTDLALPHQDGTVMMQLASKMDPDLMMVVISGHLSDDSDTKLRNMGAYEIIQKPFDLQWMRHVVNSALDTRTRNLRHNQKEISELKMGDELIDG